MIDVLQEHNLTQMNHNPTRMDNILDLTCTTNPDLVKHVSVHPGMSDHMVVISELDISAKQTKKQPREVLLYKKGNMAAITDDMDKLLDEVILAAPPDASVEHLWNEFKHRLTDSIKRNIPQKMVTGRWDVPWMTKLIKRKIRQKQRLYNRARKTGKDKDWHRFRALRKHIKSILKEAHDN